VVFAGFVQEDEAAFVAVEESIEILGGYGAEKKQADCQSAAGCEPHLSKLDSGGTAC
jgi:hypothetical protein